MNITFNFLIVALISYLLGSVNFSIILSRAIQKKDIRNGGSGNAGATNMYRTYGKKFGLATMIGDIIKVLIAILIARAIIGGELYAIFPALIKYFAGFFCVMGHIFPLYFGFKGGKGVSTCAGMILFLDWRIFLIELAIFIIVVGISKMVSLGSCIMAVIYPILTLLFFQSTAGSYSVSTPLDFIIPYERLVVVLIALLFSIIVLIKHKENIKRIFKGTENKISFGKEKKPEK